MDIQKINNLCLIFISAVLLTVGLIYTRSILIPFVISVFLAIPMATLDQCAQDVCKIPSFVSTTITIILAVILLATIVLFIANSVEDFLNSTATYENRIYNVTTYIQSWLTELGFDIRKNFIQQEIKNLPVMSWVQNLSARVFNLMGNFALITIFILFLLPGMKKAPDSELRREIQTKVSQYLTVKLSVSLVTALIVGVILFAFGVDLAFMFIVLTFLLNFIPNLGSLVSTALPLPVIFLQYGWGWELITLFILLGGIQFSVGNLIEPKMMGESLNLHPIAILIFLMFWGLVWGVAGMFLAVPITAIMKIVLSRIEPTQPLAELLSDSK